jgi:hypothetical protein
MASGFSSHVWRVSALVFLAASTISATLTVDNGKLLSVNGVDYYSGDAVSRISPSGHKAELDDIVPMTIIRTDEALLTANAIKEIISNYSDVDDVFQTGFLESEYES